MIDPLTYIYVSIYHRHLFTQHHIKHKNSKNILRRLSANILD